LVTALYRNITVAPGVSPEADLSVSTSSAVKALVHGVIDRAAGAL